MPQLTEIGLSDGGSWFLTKTFNSNPLKLSTDSPICASRGPNSNITKVYFWRPSKKPAVCWSANPGTDAVITNAVVWKDRDMPLPPPSPKL